MKQISTLRGRRRGLVSALLTALAVPAVMSGTRAQTNYCPGSPWNCTTYQTCASFYWCVNNPSKNCSFLQPDNLWGKYYIVKECTNGGNSQFCTACGAPAKTSSCCTYPDGTSEPTCPNGTGCQ
jgi:hypothetical protein